MSVRTLSAEEVAAMVREVTDEEVAFYLEHGWVKLPGLVAPELIVELRRVGEERDARDTHRDFKTRVHAHLAMQPDTGPCRTFVFSEVMRRNAQRLINRKRLDDRDVPVRYRDDGVWVNPPGPAETTLQCWHQDSPEHGTDRVGEMKFWIALHDIGPELGPMRFIDRSHREGPFGVVLNDDFFFNKEDPRDLVDLYPKLMERVTPPMEYKAGDATAHDGYTVHGTLPNTSDRPRLSHIIHYAPADTRVWTDEFRNSGSKRTLLDDESYPIFYPREGKE